MRELRGDGKCRVRLDNLTSRDVPCISDGESRGDLNIAIGDNRFGDLKIRILESSVRKTVAEVELGSDLPVMIVLVPL